MDYILNIPKIHHISYVLFYVNYVVNKKEKATLSNRLLILFGISSDLLLRLQLKEQPEE
jgi:hypothetical protein